MASCIRRAVRENLSQDFLEMLFFGEFCQVSTTTPVLKNNSFRENKTPEGVHAGCFGRRTITICLYVQTLSTVLKMVLLLLSPQND